MTIETDVKFQRITPAIILARQLKWAAIPVLNPAMARVIHGKVQLPLGRETG